MAYIVTLGGAGDGLTFYGPFPCYDSALEWAENESGGLDWSICPLTSPDS